MSDNNSKGVSSTSDSPLTIDARDDDSQAKSSQDSSLEDKGKKIQNGNQQNSEITWRDVFECNKNVEDNGNHHSGIRRDANWSICFEKLSVQPLDKDIPNLLQRQHCHNILRQSSSYAECEDENDYGEKQLALNRLAGLLNEMIKNDKKSVPAANQFSKLPSEILCKIFRYCLPSELRNYRSLSRRIQALIQENREIGLVVNIGEAQLSRTKMITLPSTLLTSKSYKLPFRSMLITIKVMTEGLKNQLLAFFSLFDPTVTTLVELHVESTPDSRILHSFLHIVSTETQFGSQSLQISLMVGSFTCLGYCINNPNASIYHPINSITLLAGLGSDKDRACCLLQLLRRAKNLKSITIGYKHNRSKTGAVQLVNFLKAVNLQKIVKISVFNLNGLTQAAINDLRRNQIIFDTVHFLGDALVEHVEFLNQFGHSLKVIYLPKCTPIDPTFPSFKIFDLGEVVDMQDATCFQFLKLKEIRIRCNGQSLSELLEKTPNLRKLIWWPQHHPDMVTTRGAGGAISPISTKHGTPKLTSLTMVFDGDKNEDEVKFIMGGGGQGGHNYFSNVTCLKLHMLVQTRLLHLFTYFSNVTQFKYYNYGDLADENLLGLPESLLDHRYRDPLYLDRPCYIGTLKELRVLDFGLLNYHYMVDKWKWRVQLVSFTHGICHLAHLRQIIFPPLNWQVAEYMVAFLALRMKQLKFVVFQVWAGNVLPEGDLTSARVDQLRSAYDEAGLSFHIVGQPVMPEHENSSFIII